MNSSNNIKFRGTSFEIKFSFLLFNALIFLFRDSRVIFGFYTVCAVHELGHIIAIFLTGGSIREVTFSGTGIRIVPQKNPTEPVSHGIFILLSGPTANIILFMLSGFTRISSAFGLLNLGAAIYNLLPYRQLDGGAVIELIFGGTVNEYTAMRIVGAVQLILSAFLLIMTFVSGIEILPFFIISLILFVSDKK